MSISKFWGKKPNTQKTREVILAVMWSMFAVRTLRDILAVSWTTVPFLFLWPFVNNTGSSFSPPCFLLLSWNKWDSLQVKLVVLLGPQGRLLGASSDHTTLKCLCSRPGAWHLEQAASTEVLYWPCLNSECVFLMLCIWFLVSWQWTEMITGDS